MFNIWPLICDWPNLDFYEFVPRVILNKVQRVAESRNADSDTLSPN